MASLIFKVLQKHGLTMLNTFIGTSVQFADQQNTPRAKGVCTLLQCSPCLMISVQAGLAAGHWHWLDIPDVFCVLIDGAVR